MNVQAGPWRAANNGRGKHIWFLFRDGQDLPVMGRYHFGASGQLVRYATFESAERAAHKLNAGPS